MSNLTRWGGREAVSLREAMDRLLEDSFVRFGGFSFGPGAGLAPLLNVYETGDDIVVEAALPGIEPDDISVSITGDVLTIKGESKQAPRQDQGTLHRQEWQYASFERSLTLPVQVDADRATSQYENGVLTLTLPKAEAVKPKRVQIKTK